MKLVCAWCRAEIASEPGVEVGAGTSHGQSDDVTLDATMTPAQAYAVLGLQPGASKEDIRRAHRHLSQRLHPDHGGNDALCSLINQARDVLLKS